MLEKSSAHKLKVIEGLRIRTRYLLGLIKKKKNSEEINTIWPIPEEGERGTS